MLSVKDSSSCCGSVLHWAALGFPCPSSTTIACRPQTSCVVRSGKTLGRDSALHVLACVARGGGGDSVAMIGGAGLEVLDALDADNVL